MTVDVFSKISKLMDQGKACVIATVVQVEGSAPRGEGAKMVFAEDGSLFGSIGGDRAEEIIEKKAKEALACGENDLVELVLEEEEEGGVGMRCGGRIKVSLDVVKPQPRLVLVGSGKIAIEVARLAQKTGFRITIIDPAATQNDFPDEVEVITENLEKALIELEANKNTYVGIISRHEHDKAGLTWALGGNPEYVGLMGSENRVNSVLSELKEKEGVTNQELASINAPIGLGIEAETPSEIAVSIVGELIKVRRN